MRTVPFGFTSSLAVVLLALSALSATTAARRPRSPVAWARYVESPVSRTVVPMRIVTIAGSVEDAQALLHPGSGEVTTLSYAGGDVAPTIVLDYGREVGGYPRFDVTAVSGAPTLRAAYSETRAQLSASGDQAVTPALFTSSEGKRFDDYQVAAPGPITNRYIQGGERYELVTLTTPGVVSLRSAAIQFTGALGTPTTLRGYFLSSSDLLNRIWYAGIYTLNLNQQPPGTTGVEPREVGAEPLLLDGAKRDRAVWTGDQAISDLSVYDALDPAYARGSIALIGAHPGSVATTFAYAVGDPSKPGPLAGACAPFTEGPGCIFWSASYSMLFVVDLYEYYLYTGDLAFVRQEWPLVARQMSWDREQVDSRGLIRTTTADGADWNVDSHPGELTYVNAVYVMALTDAARLAEALGSSVPASSYLASARSVTRAVNAHLWDPRIGAYDASTTQRGTVVQDANVFAILSGVAPANRSRVLAALLARALKSRFGAMNTALPAPPGYTPIVSPYIGGFQLQADFETGQAALALALIRSEWGWMIAHDPGGTDWEKVELSGVPKSIDSTAHAWSTGATSALTQYVLGVAPIAPGYRSLLVEPHPGNLDWAQGSVPTAHGPVIVNWRQTGCGGFVMHVTVPAGTSASLAVPRTERTSDVVVNGRVAWSGHHRRARARRADPGYVYLPRVGRGRYLVRAAANCPAAGLGRLQHGRIAR